MPKFDKEHIQAWMDIQVGEPGKPGHKKNRIVIELFNKDLPKTCENFRALCTGEMGQNLHYRGRQI
jgi:hypothetical protein